MVRRVKNDIIEISEIASMKDVSSAVHFDDLALAANETEHAAQSLFDNPAFVDALDPTSMYLAEMGKSVLLSAQEEIDLGNLVQKGDRAARKRMIESNLKLVVSMAKRYSNRGVALGDLIEEGNIGLMTAVDKFDPSRGCRFSTHATWWIRDSIERAIMNQTRTVRLPTHIIKELNVCLRTAKELGKKTGTLASPEKVAAHLKRSAEDVRWLMNLAPGSVSIDESLSNDDEDEKTMLDILEDENNLDPAVLMEQDSLSEKIQSWLSQLDEKYRQVVTLRFGLGDLEKMTLEKVSEVVGLTRERVRQMQNEAVEWLREIFMEEETA